MKKGVKTLILIDEMSNWKDNRLEALEDEVEYYKKQYWNGTLEEEALGKEGSSQNGCLKSIF